MTRELQSVFEEVGAERFTAGVDSIIRQHPYQLFPTVAELRGHIPLPTEDDAKKQRYVTLKEKFELEGFLRDINYLSERANKYPDDARRCHFHRSRLCGIFHWWLRQHPACVERVPDHLDWVVSEDDMQKYVAENPPPATRGNWNT